MKFASMKYASRMSFNTMKQSKLRAKFIFHSKDDFNMIQTVQAKIIHKT